MPASRDGARERGGVFQRSAYGVEPSSAFVDAPESQSAPRARLGSGAPRRGAAASAVREYMR